MMNRLEQELSNLDEKGLRRRLSFRDQLAHINFSSNDYLGLSVDPSVIHAAVKAVEKWGTGAGSSRLLAGSLSVHQELEESLANFLGKEAALVFGSGYHTNTGILPSLACSHDVIFFDHACHASLIDGVKLSQAQFYSFRHNDMGHLEKRLHTKRSHYDQAFIVTEGLFSMDGDFGPIEEICGLAKQWNALVVVDEAHSFGVYGEHGRGWAHERHVLSHIDIFVGTLSKTLGAQGGFVAAAKPVIDMLITKSRSFIYSTALAPSSAAAALAALKRLPDMERRRSFIKQQAHTLANELTKMGYRVMSNSIILPVWTGDIQMTKQLSDHLFTHGFFVPSIRPPTVAAGEGRVRLSMTYSSVASGLDQLIEAFLSYGKRPLFKGDRIAETS